MSVLANRAMLVSLSMPIWTATRLDRKATAEVSETHGAAADAGRYNKQLIDKAALAPVQEIASRARLHFYANSLPWSDQGYRMMSNTRFFDMSNAMHGFKAEFDAAVATFMAEYAQHRERARLRLNTLFNEDEYPTEEAVRSKFGFRFSVLPLPTAEDFRVDIADDAADLIRQQITAQTQTAVQEAMQSVVQQVITTVSHVADRLSSDGRLFSSVFTNVDDLVERLPHLNLTDDPTLTSFCNELKTRLTDIDVKDVKNDPAARSDIAKTASDIVSRMRGVYGL